jgi:DNA-directed RNA polymerase specialized sigma subunit
MMNKSPQGQKIKDTELLKLFQQEPALAWNSFCEKYSDFIYTVLRQSGFDYDEAMERFVYVFEKLCEDDFRRLRSVKYAGDKGDLTPWLRQVVKNLSVNWAWSENGRKRFLGFVKELPQRDQRIFQLYFWQGKTPFEIYEVLRLEHDREVRLEDVFEGLEKVNRHLSEKKLWRLISGLSRTRKTLSLDKENEQTGLKIEPVDEKSVSPEKNVQKKQTSRAIKEALENLSTREQLVIRFRYEESLTLGEIAEMLRWEKREAVNLHKSAIYKLRKILK